MTAAEGDRPLPPGGQRFGPGFRARLSPGVTVNRDAQVLLGGRPTRLVRSRPEDVETIRALSSGETIVVRAENIEVVTALLDRDLVQPVPAGNGVATTRVTVVIPVRDHLDYIAALLSAPKALAEAAEILVVDDASSDPDALRAVVTTAAHPNVRMVRMDVGRGPAAARNYGAALARTDVLAFVDADCMPESGWMAPLLAHFDDAKVGAAAPRVRAQEHSEARASSTTEALLAFELARGPLETGPEARSVGPGHQVLHVPSAAILVRKAAFEAVEGFDERFDRPTGEDTDFEWRMVQAGWTVRYEPSSEVRHPVRADLVKVLRQRFVYQLSEATLARRHPGVSNMRVEPANLVALVLAARGRIGAAVGVLMVGCVVPAPFWQRSGFEMQDAVRKRIADQRADAHGLALSVWRRYWPLTLCLSVVSRRFRRLAFMVLVGPGLVDWVRRRPEVPPWRWAAFHVMEQLAGGAGTWVGCLRARNFSTLVPRWAAVPRRAELVPPSG